MLVATTAACSVFLPPAAFLEFTTSVVAVHFLCGEFFLLECQRLFRGCCGIQATAALLDAGGRRAVVSGISVAVAGIGTQLPGMRSGHIDSVCALFPVLCFLTYNYKLRRFT